MLREPEVLLTHTPRIPGPDGRKMSKSYGNFITLSESDDDIRKKTKVMITDPRASAAPIPAIPTFAPSSTGTNCFRRRETLAWAAQGCRTAGIGCIECKAAMADDLIKWIEPVRAAPRRLRRDPAAGSRISGRRFEARAQVAQKRWPASAKPSSTGTRSATKSPARAPRKIPR